MLPARRMEFDTIQCSPISSGFAWIKLTSRMYGSDKTPKVETLGLLRSGDGQFRGTIN